ncbi:MAG: HD domain-containing protein [Deltaproteobacteria bacterium]|jgi:PAS domain S-box-containing protein/putative nucleotidyltransferase with HDIG domain|nr:HD domain-containing protein [Deltaproteobacteria bacterium]
MDKPIRVLIIDDSEDDCFLLVRQLKKGDFRPTYERVDAAETMSDALNNHHWDLILCDYSMPGFSAFSALEIYSQNGLDMPFIIVSGTIADEIAVDAMKAGAHDYIMKNNMARLNPAIERELREAENRRGRKRADQELKRSEEKYRTLFEESRDAIYMSAQQGDLIDFNQSTLDLFGYSREEMFGLGTEAIFVDIDEYNRFRKALEQKGSVRDFEARLLKEDGTEMYCLISSTVRQARDQSIAGYQGIIRDISELISNRNALEETLKELRKALGGTIEAMAFTVETRDPYTAGHQRRVSNLASAIATEMDISENRVEGIRLAGVIHDIGKISVPGEILSKPGRISKHEFGIIKEHPMVGYNILKTVDFPWPIAQIVRQHHERFDGSGYPDGLAGEDILLEARIMAVADVVEAMASHRPYRASLGTDIALREIAKNRDILYDPQVVDACLRLFNDQDYRF